MRSIFFKKLHELMRKDERFFLLIGDTGFNLVEPLFEEFPKRTLNVGVAEQNLIGIAAGLANVGFRPVCYAISHFLVWRCLEQIRNDICLHNYQVILAGTSAGYDNASLGPTHHSVDDIGCLKPLPKIAIYSPHSKESVETVFEEVVKGDFPAYIRIAKSSFSEENQAREVNRFVLEVPDSKIVVISHGKIVKNALDAREGRYFSVYAMDRIKPLDTNALRGLFERFSKIVVAEDNFRSGLFNSICQAAVEEKMPQKELYFIGPKDEYEDRTGDLDYLLDKHGLSAQKIREFVMEIL